VSEALTVAELEQVKTLSNSCARHFYRFTSFGQLNQVVLVALFKVTLGYSNSDAQRLMEETMAERERHTAEGRTVDPLVVALVKMSHIKCLQGRDLADDDLERLYTECSNIAYEVRTTIPPKPAS
jgi:hypothetical protein